MIVGRLHASNTHKYLTSRDMVGLQTSERLQTGLSSRVFYRIKVRNSVTTYYGTFVCLTIGVLNHEINTSFY